MLRLAWPCLWAAFWPPRVKAPGAHQAVILLWVTPWPPLPAACVSFFFFPTACLSLNMYLWGVACLCVCCLLVLCFISVSHKYRSPLGEKPALARRPLVVLPALHISQLSYEWMGIGDWTSEAASLSPMVLPRKWPSNSPKSLSFPGAEQPLSQSMGRKERVSHTSP